MSDTDYERADRSAMSSEWSDTEPPMGGYPVPYAVQPSRISPVRFEVGRPITLAVFPLRIGKRIRARDLRQRKATLTVTHIDRAAGVITIGASRG